MSAAEFGSLTLSLVLLIAAAHFFGWVFSGLRQPRVVGEILAGILLGPAVLGAVAPDLSATVFAAANTVLGLKQQAVIGFLSNLGLVLLMFASGAETHGLFSRSERKPITWLLVVGTALPFLSALAISPWLPLDQLIGPAQARTPLLLVVAIAVAVTSIPVISKIFHDLGILDSRFAHIVLGVAVLEDIVLWCVLAVATALAASADYPGASISGHLIAAVLYFGLGLTIFPAVLQRATRASWNVFPRISPVAYVVIVLLAYVAVAAALGVNLVFAAFLAGYALRADTALSEARAALSTVSFAVFIPIYFAVVGLQLDLTRSFSLSLLIGFLTLTSLVKVISGGIGARLAGFGAFHAFNLAVALNARGGPGIVVATVAFDARIINAQFYTTLVIVAVFTSQVAGAWIGYVIRRRWTLLSS